MRTLVPVQTKIKLAEKWMALGYANEASFMADVCDQIAFGRDEMMRLHERRLDALLGIGQKKDTGNK